MPPKNPPPPKVKTAAVDPLDGVPNLTGYQRPAGAVPEKVNGHASPFLCRANGEIRPILANVITLLREHESTWDLGYDNFSARMFKGDEFLEDKHFLELTEWSQRQGVFAGVEIVATAAQHIARERPFHQVTDYLESLTWDGLPRLDGMLQNAAGAEDTPLTRAQSAKWMIQAVARVYDPGCQADATLVFEGAQGLGKSSFFRVLFGDKWFTDHLPDLQSKDALLQLRGVWCVEVSDFATFSKADSKRINQFLTSRVDRYRDPYGRLVADYYRQNVFAGTVNPGAGGYLKDETGARRFWSVAVSPDLNLNALADARDQLWAEAVARYKDGELWYLNTLDIAKDAAVAQAERYIGDPWQEKIEKFLENKNSTTNADIFVECLNITAVSDWDQRSMNRIASCLSHMRWERFRKPKDLYGKRAWGYRPGPDARPTLADLELGHDDFVLVD